MRGEYQTQMICISETNGAIFELKMNEALKPLVNPDIRLDPNRSFTAYIFYQIKHDVPETVVEAIELTEGVKYHCKECPACKLSEDARKKHGFCTARNKNVHYNMPVCIEFYKLRNDQKDLEEQLPAIE